MHYYARRNVLYISAEELCSISAPLGSIGATAKKRESTREKIRDSIALELGPNAKTDLYLDSVISFSGINYQISATADVLISQGNSALLYVISSEKSTKSVSPHLYSYGIITALLVATELQKDNIIIRFAFGSADDKKFTVKEQKFSANELSKEVNGKLSKVERFARLCINWETLGKPSIKEMKFPFGNMRKGQRELIEEVYRAVLSGSRLFATAPTGIGKTISVLYPAVKALGESKCDKIFYLTAKASTKKEAFSAIRKMFDTGAELKVIILNSKEQMCSNAAAKMSGARVSSFCSDDICEMSKDYYCRSEDAIFELLTTANGYTPRLIADVAKKYRVCPYELSLDLSEHCDVVICDYNYVFDPSVRIRRYFGDTQKYPDQNYVFLIDEAHNLPDRLREMYSAELSLSVLEEHLSYVPADEGKLFSEFGEIIRAFKALKQLCSDNLSKDFDGFDSGFYFGSSPLFSFSEKLQKFASAIELYVNRHRGHPLAETLYELLSTVRAYLSSTEYFDEHFRLYVLVHRGDITLKTYCIDPSGVADECMKRAISSILFSATLSPADYYVDILGGSENAVKITLPSPYDSDNFCICAMTGISTRYEDRQDSADKVAKCIAAAVLAKKGNYIAYFPSYSYMEAVAKRFHSQYAAVNILVQKRGMTYSEKEEFLDFFKDDGDVLRIGFCVMGGSFSEGVDLPGSRLIGSIIVGVGLPQISNELNIIRDFYELKYERGYDYAYTFPGMNKVLQACGRVIRRENDKGIAVLIDDRYGTPLYRSLFPEHWENIFFASSVSELAKKTKDFWQN